MITIPIMVLDVVLQIQTIDEPKHSIEKQKQSIPKLDTSNKNTTYFGR
jgi:hypothetical protein